MEAHLAKAANVVKLQPRKTSDIVSEIRRSGKAQPLELMCQLMWKLADEAERLEASYQAEDAMIARVTRDRLFRCASEVAPYFHSKLATTTIAGDPQNPLLVERGSGPPNYRQLSDDDAGEFLRKIESGELTPRQVAELVRASQGDGDEQ
jgi:hypothetical protein